MVARISRTIWTMEDTLPDYQPEAETQLEITPASA
jgi:hypothetical protein